MSWKQRELTAWGQASGRGGVGAASEIVAWVKPEWLEGAAPVGGRCAWLISCLAGEHSSDPFLGQNHWIVGGAFWSTQLWGITPGCLPSPAGPSIPLGTRMPRWGHRLDPEEGLWPADWSRFSPVPSTT